MFAWINMVSGNILLNDGGEIPQGYSPANGREVRRKEYPELFANIGVTYGKGDGRFTFNLPRLVQG